MSRPRSRVFLTLAMLLLAGACASAGGKRERGSAIEVQIINDLIPPRSVTVEIAPAQGGNRAVLGSVAPSQSHSFSYRPPVTGTDYVVTAEDPEGHTITSRTFPLGSNDIVVWSLRNNQLELRK